MLFSLILAAISASTATAAILMIIRQYKSYGPVTKALLSVTALDDILGGRCVWIFNVVS